MFNKESVIRIFAIILIIDSYSGPIFFLRGVTKKNIRH